MQPILTAYAEAIDDRGSSHDNCAAGPPKEPPVYEQPEEQPQEETEPRRRRWRWPGNIFLDGPSTGGNARRWQTACGQGG